jgi:hypothetical protein
MNRKGDILLVKFDASRILHDKLVFEGELVLEKKKKQKLALSLVDGGGSGDHGDDDHQEEDCYRLWGFELVYSTALPVHEYLLTLRLKLLQYIVNDIRPSPHSRESPFLFGVKRFVPLPHLQRFLNEEGLTHLIGAAGVRDNDSKRSVSLSSSSSSMLPNLSHLTDLDLGSVTTTTIGAKKSCHPCDGLLLIRNDRFVKGGTDHEFFKLKPGSFNTLEFSLTFQLTRWADVQPDLSSEFQPTVPSSVSDTSALECFVCMWAISDNGRVLIYAFPWKPIQTLMLKKTTGSAATIIITNLMVMTMGPEEYEKVTMNRVFECREDEASGQWVPQMVREKNTPNHIAVVRDVLKGKRENIGVQELLF